MYVSRQAQNSLLQAPILTQEQLLKCMVEPDSAVQYCSTNNLINYYFNY